MNEIKTLKTDHEVSNKVNCLIYGQSGIGKTRLAGTLDPKKTIMITPDIRGLKSLKKVEWSSDLWYVESHKDMVNFYKELLKDEIKKKYDTVYVDDLNEIFELIKRYIVEIERPQKKVDIGKVYDELMQLQDYQLLKVKFQKLMECFRDISYDVIFTCLEGDKKDDQTGMIKSYPLLSGEAPTYVSKYFDFVGRYITKGTGENTERYILTQPTQKSDAKDRTGNLDQFELPNLKNIISKMKGEKK